METESAEGSRTAPKKRPDPITSLGQLVKEVFRAKRPRSTLKKAEVQAIETGPALGDVRAECLRLSAGDYTLDRTRQLLTISMTFTSVGPFLKIADFVRDVLKDHPAFQEPPVQRCLAGPSESSSEEYALRILASQKYPSLQWPPGTPPLKKAQIAKCKSNALQCLILLFWLGGEKSIPELIDRLRKNLWRSVPTGKSPDNRRLAAFLMQTREPASAIVYDLMKLETERAMSALTAVREDEQNAVRRAQKAEHRLTDALSKIEEQEIEIADLENKLKALEQDFSNNRAVSGDRYESLRGRVLGKLRSELSLLDEGLHALRRDPPKVYVMIDHAERAIDTLKREIAELEER